MTDEVKQQIYAILTIGGSLDDAAGYLEIDRATIWRAMKANARFATGVKKAVRAGKLKLIKKVGSSSAWQASAWMLERKYGKEFGRKEIVQNQHSGSIKTEPSLAPLTVDELRTLRALRAKMEQDKQASTN